MANLVPPFSGAYALCCSTSIAMDVMFLAYFLPGSHSVHLAVQPMVRPIMWTFPRKVVPTATGPGDVRSACGRIDCHFGQLPALVVYANTVSAGLLISTLSSILATLTPPFPFRGQCRA